MTIHTRARWRCGLRLKFNAILIPLVAAIFAVLVTLDYRHEFRSVMDAHAMHAQPVGAAALVRPVRIDNTPTAVAGRALAMHVVAAGLTILVLMAAVNVTLSRLVLTPLRRIRVGIERLQPRFPTSDSGRPPIDEAADVAAAFNALGLSIDAILRHSIETDRLATRALLAKAATARIEPEVRRLGAAAASLQGIPHAAARATAHDVGRSAARLYSVLRDFDAPFETCLGGARVRIGQKAR